MSRNLLRTKAVVLVPLAALTAVVATVEAQQSDGTAATAGPRSTAASVAPVLPAAITPSATPSVTPQLDAASTTDAPPASVTGPGQLSGALTVGGGNGPLLGRLSSVAVSGAGATSAISSTALSAYQRAASVIDQADTSCNLGWELLAAIGTVESGNGTAGGSQLSPAGLATPAIYGPDLDGTHHTQQIADTDGGQLDGDPTSDRAVGPMQFLPSTWVMVAVDGDGDGRRDPQDINDAALASAVYLCSTGADLSTPAAQHAALLRYNHSDAYATRVQTLATSYSTDDDLTGVVPATFLVPTGSAGATATTDATAKQKKTKKHQTTKKHHHKAAHTSTTSASTSSTSATPGTTPGKTSGTPTTGASTGPTTTAPGAATTAQLTEVCQLQIASTYPDATDDAVQAALTRCLTLLDGLTLAQAKAQVQDVVEAFVDPDTTDGPIAGLEPTGTPTEDPSGSASDAPSTGSSDDPSDDTGSTDPSASASPTASATN
ncbi:lytic transglycosylase domain-containing protein [Nocardioides sp. BP30]|uniref:lytic transglycosylase domain-containing protein n=1 Tax=Nocardioides sp. BP30 TaxID=3036374 RepID=UPI00246901D0|nr:lytic transglycosylase domain-containing protein [Nocardioides sp. BP30]WGL50984.1 lytic transglycosylase domain-containing protein [Nocardioides sp. BP30]